MKPVLWIIIVAFVGTIIFAWGMDFTSRPAERGIIGVVDGFELKIDAYSFLYQNSLAQQQQQGIDITDAQAIQLQDQVFEQMVQARVLQNVIDELGFEVTNRELALYLRRFPPQELQQVEFFQTDGRFDFNKYVAAYENPDPQLWLQIEAIVTPRLMQQKIIEYITATALVNDLDVRELYDAAIEKVSVRYVLAASTKYRDSIGPPSDDMVNAYYADHEEDFRHGDRAKLHYVLFPKQASAEDTARVIREAEDLARRARAGEDFGRLAADYSDDETPNGSLGWFGAGAMVKAFEDVAFALDTGEVSEPVKSQFGYHVIKVHERREADDELEVNASHILLKVEISPGTISDLRLSSGEFSDLAREEGIDSAAIDFGTIVRQTSYFESGERILSIGDVSPINAFAFQNNPNAVSGVFETASGYFVVSVADRDPAGTKDLDEVRGQIVRQLNNERMLDYAYGALQPLQDQLTNGVTLDEGAADLSLKIDTTGLFGRMDIVTGIGADPAFRGIAFSLNETGERSPILKTQRGAVILELIEQKPVDPQDYVERRDSLMETTQAGKQQLIFNGWMAQLRERADVKDYRDQLPGSY